MPFQRCVTLFILRGQQNPKKPGQHIDKGRLHMGKALSTVRGATRYVLR